MGLSTKTNLLQGMGPHCTTRAESGRRLQRARKLRICRFPKQACGSQAQWWSWYIDGLRWAKVSH
jgi:hypothetical protein